MDEYDSILEKLHSISHMPLTLVSADLQILGMWPAMPEGHLNPATLELLLTDFRLQKRNCLHPLISHIQPGFFLGVCALEPNLFAIIGLVSPVSHSRQEILEMCAPVVDPAYLQQLCDVMLRAPLTSLEQVKDLICLLVQLTQKQAISKESILFNDVFMNRSDYSGELSKELFAQRETADFHVPANYETSVCLAIENGSKKDLMKVLYSPVQGQVGRMSANALRQEKYAMICLATLVSRAAIRGGLPAETAFSMSDTYCQGMDQMKEVTQIQRVVYTMLTDYCEKVHEVRAKQYNSPVVQKCLDYISVHLHETITLDELSAHCGLCGRSLSLQFRKELNMGIPEYIHREKIKEAKYLLRHTDYSLSEISCFLNYPSQSYFTQIFKKYEDKTPQQYRENRK